MPLTPYAIARATPVGRYAPSPTGTLHLGNLRTALVAWQDAVEHGAAFILRIEDTDYPRNVPGAEQRILSDLAWLGITWDEGPSVMPGAPDVGPAAPYRQSQRHEIYLAALLHLADLGLIYPCTCSRKQLQSAASAPHGPDGPVYPGTCRKRMPAGEMRELIAQLTPPPGKAPGGPNPCALRLRTDELPPLSLTDELHGARVCDVAGECGDFVVLRRDGLWAYQFVCAVDDALMGVTRVVRGADLLSSAPRQAALVRALGYQPPVYRHIPLVADAQGQRMAKRDGSVDLSILRGRGLSPEQARRYLLDLTTLSTGTCG